MNEIDYKFIEMKADLELTKQWQEQHMHQHDLEQHALQVARSGDAVALAIAREDVNRRLEGMNELRTQINEERGRFLQRDRYEAERDSNRESTDVRLKSLETNKSNLEGRMWAIGAALSAFVVVLNIAMYYLRIGIK
jgi:hypothetical protein